MNIVSIKHNDKFLGEYIKLCSLEWSTPKTKNQMLEYIDSKKQEMYNGDKVIEILGLIDKDVLVGFISLFKHDGNNYLSLTPWYATMYVKKEYRGKGYSKLLNDALLKEAYKLGYDKVYLKTNLINYYEKFGAIYLKKINDYEDLYYFDLKK